MMEEKNPVLNLFLFNYSSYADYVAAFWDGRGFEESILFSDAAVQLNFT